MYEGLPPILLVLMILNLSLSAISNKLWFSVKKALFSLKRVSSAVKFTTKSSLSAWPKSGLNAAFIWLPSPAFQKISIPILDSFIFWTELLLDDIYGK